MSYTLEYDDELAEESYEETFATLEKAVVELQKVMFNSHAVVSVTITNDEF